MNCPYLPVLACICLYRVRDVILFFLSFFLLLLGYGCSYVSCPARVLNSLHVQPRGDEQEESGESVSSAREIVDESWVSTTHIWYLLGFTREIFVSYFRDILFSLWENYFSEKTIAKQIYPTNLKNIFYFTEISFFAKKNFQKISYREFSLQGKFSRKFAVAIFDFHDNGTCIFVEILVGTFCYSTHVCLFIFIYTNYFTLLYIIHTYLTLLYFIHGRYHAA